MKNERFEIFSSSVLRLVRSVQQLKARKMAEYDLKGTTAAVLCRIFESGNGLTAALLATVCEIDKAQVSRAVAELTEKGFVYREASEAHRYKQKYCLTQKGRAAAQDISRTVAEVEDTVSKNLTPAELSNFYHTLYVLCDNFQELLDKNIT